MLCLQNFLHLARMKKMEGGVASFFLSYETARFWSLGVSKYNAARERVCVSDDVPENLPCWSSSQASQVADSPHLPPIFICSSSSLSFFFLFSFIHSSIHLIPPPSHTRTYPHNGTAPSSCLHPAHLNHQHPEETKVEAPKCV